MDTEEIKNKAAIKAAQRLADLQALADPAIGKLEAESAERRAKNSKRAGHLAAVEDFDAGRAVVRAVNAYRVKRTVNDLAKSEGRTLSGAAIVVPEPKPEIESATESA